MASRVTTTYSGNVTPNCLSGAPCLLGIDEAGRGPVLGPMLYGAAYWPVSENEEITALGFDDSKALTAEKREGLFKGLKETNRIGWTVASIPPDEISAKMLRRTPYSLNAISHDCAIAMIERAIDAGVNVTEVYVDTVGDPKRYQDMLTRRFQNKIKFTVAKKADSIYPCVSAASICAKVTRDKEIEDWKYREPGFVPKGPLGSGYPGDAITKEWIKMNTDTIFGFPSLVRFSWSTSRDLLEKEATMVEW